MPVRCYKSQASIAFNPIHFISLTVPQVHGNRATDECRPACCQKKIEVFLVSLFLRPIFVPPAADIGPKPCIRLRTRATSRKSGEWVSIMHRQKPLPLFSQSPLLRLLEVKCSATPCTRKYANLAHVDPAQMADNPIALVDNRCKAWLDSVVKASGFHPGPEQAAIQGLPFGHVERPNVDANSIGNQLVARIAEHWRKLGIAKRDVIEIGTFVNSERTKPAAIIVNIPMR